MAIGSILQISPFNTKPSAPPVGSYELYVKTDNTLYLQDSSGNEYPFAATTAITQLTGDVSAVGPGSAIATVNFVGGASASSVATAATAVSTSTSANTANTLVKRDSSGNFSAGTITAALSGNATTATTATSFSGVLSGDVTGTQSTTVVATVGGKTASDIASAVTTVDAATPLNLSSTLVQRDASGNFNAGTITAALAGNATTATSAITATTSTNFTGSLSGDVTGTQSATAISSTVVTAKLLTGYSVGSNTALAATDTILVAFGKIQGQLNAATGSAITSLTGDVSATGPGSSSATVNSVGGSSASNIHSAELLANASTNLNTALTIVKRDASGNFSAGNITAHLIGSSSLNVLKTGDSMSGVLDMTGNLIVNVSPPITSTDAANKDYVDNLAVGIIPQTAILDDNLIADSLSTPPVSPTQSSYLIGPAPTGAWTSFGAGHIVYWTGSSWVDVLNRAVQGGDRLGINFHMNGTLSGGFTGKQDNIAIITNPVPGAYTYTFNVPMYRWTVNINNFFSVDAGDTYYYNGTQWSLLSSGFVPSAGDAIDLDASTINVIFDGTTISINGSNELTVLNSPNFTNALSGDVTGTQSATSVVAIQGHAVSGTTPTDGQLLIYNSGTSRYNPLNFSGDISITDTGATTIQPNTVSNSKLAQMSANTVKANITGGTANPTDASLGTVTESTSSVLTLTGWTNATIGSPTITVKQSSTSQSGYLSSTDWNTFNNKQSAGNYITALTGDVVAAGPGSASSIIQTNVVTNGKLAQTPANTIKGNNTGVTANVTDLTISQVVALLAVVTTVGSFNGGSANANGATITSPNIFFQSASATVPGMVDNTIQTLSGNKTFSGQTAISNTSTTAFTVNSTSFVFDATDNSMGIGIAPSSVSFIDAVNSTAASKTLQLTGYGVGSTVGTRGRFARGTSGTPTATQSGDTINFWSARGYGASQFATASTAAINAIAGETFTNTSNLTYLAFNTTPTGSVTSTENMRIASTGVTLGPQTASTSIHQVNGGLYRTARTITGNLTVDTTTTDDIIFCNQSGAISITLPLPTNGRAILIKDISGTTETNNITMVRHASEKIEGLNASRILYTNFGSWTFVADSSGNWWMT